MEELVLKTLMTKERLSIGWLTSAYTWYPPFLPDRVVGKEIGGIRWWNSEVLKKKSLSSFAATGLSAGSSPFR